jgi:hypothetical protein|tara:strand:+ start:186 stop:548 length:363 start_codon:yes stop_codon:yes gene_type:complete
MSNDVTDLVDALITKMERMDGDIGNLKLQNQELKKMVSSPDYLLQKSGFVKFGTPSTEDVWGDPLRGDRNEVIEKAAIAIDGVMIPNMPSSNEEWHEMNWDQIHAMANEAAMTEGRPVDQ